MVRLLHAADLHLGLRITRFEQDACDRIREARFAALQQLRDKAAELRVDFLLIAGDVFDDHTVTRGDANRAFAILEGSKDACPVFIIPGNHDPLVPGGVWDRDPWLREQPHLRVHFLREAVPTSVPGMPVTLFPCPLKQRRSIEDPTAWIGQHPRQADDGIRIGLAHGSLKIMPLPEDDHLIRPDAAEFLGLDYLALGHWHKHLSHGPVTEGGCARTCYSGVHEPMRFPGTSAEAATGWSSFSADHDAERFRDDGLGQALLVTLEAPLAPPKIEPVLTGRLRWSSECRELQAQSVSSLISEYSRHENPERTILQLQIRGVAAPREHARLDELRQIVLRRFHSGSSLNADNVLIEPNADQLTEVVGEGVLRRVLSRLQEESQAPDAAVQRIARQALKQLYQIAWEEQPK
jgi:DNA repair exonuclease SbcCD nuclease subunit